jgi:sugar lactone lactonase YvrE
LHAGTGSESAEDGAHAEATFSQPSGFATDGKVIYVADSESSTVRAVEVAPDGQTSSVAGSNNLFGFGTDDGKGDKARFQHPLGVALHGGGGTLFVADSFNNAIRRIDLATNEVTTWLGTPGKADVGTDDAIGFYEPGGISIAGDTLYVADTNHHRVVAVDVGTKKARVLKVEVPAAKP